MTKRVLFVLSVLMSLTAFLALMLCPQQASEAARYGLSLCAGVIIPSLFPFMVLGNLISQLGLTKPLGRLFSPVTEKLFGVSGGAFSCFFLGITGGYPLGAACVSDLYIKGAIDKKQGERLLGFCNNTGPAFIISVAGSAVFGSTLVGFFLYGIHIISAVFTGMLLKIRTGKSPAPIYVAKQKGFSAAFTDSVKKASVTCLFVCGFLVFFSVIMGLLDDSGALPAITGRLSLFFNAELHFVRSFFCGILELGAGISSMSELSVSPLNLALCSFVLGWGSLSVHAQTLAVTSESGLSCVWHLFGKLLHGVLSALITYFAFPLLFQ